MKKLQLFISLCFVIGLVPLSQGATAQDEIGTSMLAQNEATSPEAKLKVPEVGVVTNAMDTTGKSVIKKTTQDGIQTLIENLKTIDVGALVENVEKIGNAQIAEVMAITSEDDSVLAAMPESQQWATPLLNFTLTDGVLKVNSIYSLVVDSGGTFAVFRAEKILTQNTIVAKVIYATAPAMQIT